MDSLTVLKNTLAVLETAALAGALVISARGFQEKKNKDFRKSSFLKAAICLAVYLVLNMIRLTYFQ